MIFKKLIFSLKLVFTADAGFSNILGNMNFVFNIKNPRNRNECYVFKSNSQIIKKIKNLYTFKTFKTMKSLNP